MRKRKFLPFILILLLVLTGCSNESSENLEQKKGLSEIRFLENQHINIFNKYINDEYLSDTNEIDWDLIEDDFILLDDSIDIILIDFASLKIPSKSIVELEENFDDLNELIKNKDINAFSSKVCQNYELISTSISESILGDEITNMEKKAKSDLIYIGYYFKNLDIDNSLNYINEFEEDISKLNSNKKYIENNSYKINRIFLNTKNLRTSIIEEDFETGKELLFELLELF